MTSIVRRGGPMGDPANAARSSRIEARLEKSKLWPVRFPADQWQIYRFVMSEAQARGIPFAIGGGLASTTYAGQWRNSKDIDFYIQFENRDRMIQVLTNAG